MNFDPLSIDAELVNRLRQALALKPPGTEVSVSVDLLTAVEARMADLVSRSTGAGETLAQEPIARMWIKSDLVAGSSGGKDVLIKMRIYSANVWPEGVDLPTEATSPWYSFTIEIGESFSRQLLQAVEQVKVWKKQLGKPKH